MSGADLRKADLSGALLSGAKLNGAKLADARLTRARLIGCRLNRADLNGANLARTNLRHANLTLANLSNADMSGAKVRGADVRRADLSGANLTWAKLIGDDFQDVNLTGAQCGWTVIADANLSQARGLETVQHRGPSTMGVDTLVNSAGKIPEAFLLGCGLAPWQALQAKLYDPALTRDEVRQLYGSICHQRAKGPTYVGGVFISYAAQDEPFARHLRQRFVQRGVSSWENPNEGGTSALPLAGVQPQFVRSLRNSDVVVLVLSQASAASEWVEHELDTARKIEKAANRDVLFPVALDDSWKTRMTDTSWKAKLEDLLWRRDKTKLVVDFANWALEDCERQFQTLLRGFNIEYSPPAQSG
jgi:hypothetical protein